MIRRGWQRLMMRLAAVGMRGRLAAAISLVAALGILASFVAVYSGTTSRLRGQIDSALRTQSSEWHQYLQKAAPTNDAQLSSTTRKFIESQRYHAESLIIVAHLTDGTVISNEPQVVAGDEAQARQEGDSAGLLGAPAGMSDRTVAEAGQMRVLSEPVNLGGRRVATIRFADPLRPLSDAQSSLLAAYAVVGSIVIVIAILVGIGLAALIAAPLRRITTVASAAAKGDLSVRAGPIPGHDEVAVLGKAFDQMMNALERAFSRQRQFVSDASHELRTPLAVVRAQVELLDRELDPERRHEGNRMLLRRLDELDALVGDMLTLASAEAGRLVEPVELDLEDFFEDLRRDLPLFGDRDYRVEVIGGTVRADPARLTQVLRNLVRNAVAHTHTGDRVEVVARAVGGSLEIAVSDTGPGIPADERERIFERFHRVERSRSRDRGGTGLGLPIARAIVEAHGGWIRAEAASGQGATFRFSLPGYRPGPGPGPEPGDRTAAPQGGGRTGPPPART